MKPLPLLLCLWGCTPDATAPPPVVGWPSPTADTGGPTPVTTETTTTTYEMSGFSFIDPYVAGMPLPGRWVPLETDMAFLVGQDITLLVTLTEEPLDADVVHDAGLAWLHLPIQDFHAPTLDQQERFVASTEAQIAQGGHVGVHCLAGLGRAGTMLATWLVARGAAPQRAIDYVREQRPGSIESAAQEQAVFDYAAR